MKKIIGVFIICIILILQLNCNALNLDNNIIYNGDFKNDLEYWYLGGIDTYCSYDLKTGSDYNILKINIYEKPHMIYDVQLVQDYKTSVNTDDILLLKFSIKNPNGGIIIAVQDNGDPWEKYQWINIPISDITKQYTIAFDGGPYNWNPNNVELCFFFGQNKGLFELSNITFKNLGPNVNITSLNPDMIYSPFFGTQNVSDDWKQPALERINKIRKSPLIISCVDQNNNPLEQVKITINQTKKYFPFGVAVAADLFGGPNYNQKYVDKIKDLFNMITIENHLKWPNMYVAHPNVDYVFAWANENKIPVHGHCLFWPSFTYCPNWLEAQSTEEIYNSVLSHIENYTKEFKGKVVHWDVINEAITNNEIWELCGVQLLADCYIIAKENDPNVLLMYNDYDLLTNNPLKQNQVIDLILELQDRGASIEGLGIQGHLSTPILVTPENALKNLEKMSNLSLPIYITELDIRTDEHWDFHASYLKDLLTALYSHPSVNGIIQWGFWEGAHWRPDTALYNLDWTPRPAGLVFEDLMFHEWETNVIQFSDQFGLVQENCFHGDFKILAQYGDYNISDNISVFPNKTASIKIIFDTNNNPPFSPQIKGPTNGIVGKDYNYKISATDPNDDNISYIIDWGDGNDEQSKGPFSSGKQLIVNHTWSSKGLYKIRVKAIDEHNLESKWSSLEVSVPKTYIYNQIIQLLFKMLERFAFFEKILNRIL